MTFCHLNFPSFYSEKYKVNVSYDQSTVKITSMSWVEKCTIPVNELDTVIFW